MEIAVKINYTYFWHAELSYIDYIQKIKISRTIELDSYNLFFNKEEEQKKIEQAKNTFIEKLNHLYANVFIKNGAVDTENQFIWPSKESYAKFKRVQEERYHPHCGNDCSYQVVAKYNPKSYSKEIETLKIEKL